MTEHGELTVTWHGLLTRVRDLEARILRDYVDGTPARVWPIPRGGLYVAALLARSPHIAVASEPYLADIAVDDIIDSGATAKRIHHEYTLRTVALWDKTGDDSAEQRWVVFPWETAGREGDIADTLRRLVQQLGLSDVLSVHGTAATLELHDPDDATPAPRSSPATPSMSSMQPSRFDEIQITPDGLTTTEDE